MSIIFPSAICMCSLDMSLGNWSVLVNHEKIPIKIVGSGRDDDYGTMGFTHYATDDETISKVFKNIETIKPETNEDIDLDYFLYTKKPIYLNLKR